MPKVISIINKLVYKINIFKFDDLKKNQLIK
jgi:hypothetical protein